MDRELFFDLTPIRIRVKLPIGDCVLEEASGADASRFRTAAAKMTRTRKDGIVDVVGDPGEIESLLVSLCLKGPDGKPVQQDVIKGWPSRIVKKLFDEAFAISGLGEQETEASLAEKIDDLKAKLDDLKAEGDPAKKPQS